MPAKASPPILVAVVEKRHLQGLIDLLWSNNFTVIGPAVRDGVVLYDSLYSSSELPIGCGDEQEGGSYRITRRSDEAYFGYGLGPTSWKRFLSPPSALLWKARRGDSNDFHILPAEEQENSRFAFFGIRSCELHAIAILDKVLMDGGFVDSCYKSRRDGIFTVAVNCAHPSGTCFCASMDTGPRVALESDLVLTEVLDSDSHRFVVEVGTERGLDFLLAIPHRLANEEEVYLPERVPQEAMQRMRRRLQTDGLKELLYRSLDHPQWDEVASRCFSCGNCTMVCPTCFCTTVEDRTDLTGRNAERRRRWDSCFNMDFTYIHGGVLRSSPRARYRHWMIHKLATWIDQFGTPGCVGCGRCITWCPAAIDITEEARIFREHDMMDGATQ